jgi:hypothetical protein
MAAPSIDRKLPLLASGLVVLTALALVTAAHVSVDRALLASAQERLLTTARVGAQRIQRPTGRITDPQAHAADRTLREFLSGRRSEREAVRALQVPQSPGDTTHYYAALLNPSGYVLLEYKRQETPAPRWAANAVAHGVARGDTVLVGPIEIVANFPAVTTLRPVNDSSAGIRRVGYIVESRIITSNRSASQFRDMIGAGLELLIGQPGVGAWTDMERIAAAPPVRITSDTALVVAGTVAATARVPGMDWMVWVSQPSPWCWRPRASCCGARFRSPSPLRSPARR